VILFDQGKLRKRKYHIWLRVSLVRRIKSILNSEYYSEHPNGHYWTEYFCLCCDEHIRTRSSSGKFKNYIVTHPNFDTEEEIEVANNYPTKDFYFFDSFREMAVNSNINFPISSDDICCHCFNKVHHFFDELKIVLGEQKNQELQEENHKLKEKIKYMTTKQEKPRCNKKIEL
jgi:hypothetical protein